MPGYVFTGLGSAMLIVLWKEASSSLSAETNRLSVSIAVIGAAFLYLLQATLPFGIAVVICTLMPIGASYLFWRVLAVRDECQDAAFKGAVRSSDSPPMQDGVEYGLAVLSCAFLIGFQGVLRAMGFERPEFGTWALVTSCAVLATSVIVVADVVFSNRRNRRFTTPLSAAAMLLVSFAALTLQNGRTAEVCAICSFFLVTIFIYSLLPALHVRRMDSLQSFLLALFIVGGGESLGIALGAVATQVFHLPLLLVGLPFLIASAASIIFMLIYARNRGSYIGVDASRFNEADSPAETSFPDDWKVGFGVNVDRGQDQRQEISDAISEKCKALSSEWALSDRESEILLKIALGRPYKVIANDLFISYNTIKTHVTHIYRKAGVHTRDELLAAIFDQRQVK